MYINPTTDRDLNARVEISTTGTTALYMRLVDTSYGGFTSIGADLTVDEVRALKVEVDAFLALHS